MNFKTIILAAGHGTRMHSRLPKPLHPIGGKPMLAWVLDTATIAGAESHTVITPKDSKQIDDFIAEYRQNNDSTITAITQDPPLGTGHAVEAAAKTLKDYQGIVIVACADTPLVQAATYHRLAERLDTNEAGLACLGFHTDTPTGYGRLILDGDGMLSKIVEEKDANDTQKAISFVNAGIMAFKAPQVFDWLESIPFNPTTHEKYLTDCIEAARLKGTKAITLEADEAEVLGINDRIGLASAEAIMQSRLRRALLASGVTLAAPETVFLHHDAIIEADVTIDPHVVIGAGVHIKAGSHIKSFTSLEGVHIDTDCVVGPYARLRPGTRLDHGVKIGNFVEVKNTTMAAFSKANHLAYLGDSTIGTQANIGAGVITCNYDGFNKHQTAIGDGAFIGSNSALVAPVTIGDYALIGAGSTVTQDVSKDELLISRGTTKSLKEGAKRLRQKLKAAKDAAKDAAKNTAKDAAKDAAKASKQSEPTKT